MLDTLQRLQAFQRLYRVWRPHLTSAEADFIGWLIDCTVSYGRLDFKASVAQMVAGGDKVPALCMSARTAWRTIATLKDKGLIEVADTRYATHLTLKLDWEPPLMTLKLPKRLQQSAPLVDEFGESVTPERVSTMPDWHNDSANLAQTLCQSGTPYKDKEYRRETTVEKPSALRASVDGCSVQPVAKPETVLGAIESVRARSREPGKSNTAWAAWRDTWVLTFPEAGAPAAWDKVATSQIKKLAENLASARIDVPAFLSYVVGNWRGIVAMKFGWMRDNPPPRFPAVGFVLRFRVQFLDAYASQQTDAAIAVMPADQAQYARMIGSGMNHDEALIELGRQKGKGEARVEVADERAKVQRLHQTLARRQTEVEALQRVALKRSVAPAPKTPQAPTINHGANLYESGGMPDLPIIEMPHIDFDAPRQ